MRGAVERVAGSGRLGGALMWVRVEWKPQDCWLGVYWGLRGPRWHMWICVVPMVPIHLSWPAKGE